MADIHADIHRFSEQVIDFAERLSDVADAAKGKGRRRTNGLARWVFLPAAGAGLYALLRSDHFSRQAKDVVDEAKTRASDLPNDLLNSVRQTSQTPARRSGGSRSGGQRGRQTSAARKSKSRG
jgi:hypothetical protein